MAESQLDKFEALKAMTAEPTSDDKGKTEGRAKASQQWVAHYIAVNKIKTEWMENPETKDKPFTAEIAEALLVETWTDKAEVKKTESI